MRLLLHSGHHHQRLTEVSLCLACRVRQRNEHLLATQLLPMHVVLHDRVAAREPMLFSEPLEDPLRGMTLPRWPLLVFFKNLVDYAQPRPKLRPLHWLLPPVAGRHRVAQHLAHHLPRYAELPRYTPLTPAFNQYRSSYSPIDLHPEHPSGVP